MKHLSIIISVLVILTSTIGNCQITKEYTFTSKKEKITVPFELWNNHIYLKVKINNSQTLDFLFDNGAGSSGIMIDSSIAANLGLQPTGKINATMTGGKNDFLITDSVSLQIDSLIVLKQKVAWFLLKEQEQEEGHKIDGILSYSFFKYFVFEIDYKNQLLTIIAPENYNDNKWKNKTSMIDLDKNKVPIVSGSLITKKGKKIMTQFTIDTGHDEYFVLGKRFIMQNGLSSDTLKRQPNRVNKGLGGNTDNKAGYI